MFFIGLIIGGFVVLVIMCAIQINRINECADTVKQGKNILEHELFYAKHSDKNEEYIKGIEKAIDVYNSYFEEELEWATKE